MSTFAGTTTTTGSGSFFLNLDPRTRILVSGAFAIAIVSLHSFPSLIMALMGAVLCLGMVRLPVKDTVKKVLTMDGFIIFMLLILPFTTPGEIWFTIWGLNATWDGLFKALEIMLKANAIVLFLLTLVATMDITALGQALSRLKVPDNLVHLLLFCVRYIDVLKQEYQRLRVAMKARCFRATNSMHTYRSIGYLLGMLLVRSLERSERIHAAMKCRGFQGKLFLIDDFHFSARDYIFAAIATLFILILFAIEVQYG